MTNNITPFEILAKSFYDKEPITEVDGDETWKVSWEDLRDSYPATYEYFLEKAIRHMYQ